MDTVKDIVTDMEHSLHISESNDRISICDAKIIKLPTFPDKRGNLSVIEQFRNIPFKINRTYWIYDVPGGVKRDGYACKKSCEFIVALSGSFDVILYDGYQKRRLSLKRSYYGLFIPNGLWIQLENFSTDSLALVLASMLINPDDYIFNYNIFKKTVYEENYNI